MSRLSDDDVIMQGDAELAAGLGDLPRHLDIRAARRGIARGMIVDDKMLSAMSLIYNLIILYHVCRWERQWGAVPAALTGSSPILTPGLCGAP